MKRNLLSLATLLFAMLFSVNAFAVDEEILAANTAKVEGAQQKIQLLQIL